MVGLRGCTKVKVLGKLISTGLKVRHAVRLVRVRD